MATYRLGESGKLIASDSEKKKKKGTTYTIGENGKLIPKETEDVAESTGWFQSGAMGDGFSLKNIGKTVRDTLADAGTDILTGMVGMGEQALDSLLTVAPYVAQGQYYQNGGAYQAPALQQMQEATFSAAKEGSAEIVAKDLYDEKAVTHQLLTGVGVSNNYLENEMERNSILGAKADSLVQSGGQLIATAGLQAMGVPWFLTTGVTSFGAETENALSQGATLDEAAVSGLVSAGAEILTEKISGGIKFGGKTLDDALTKQLSRVISNKVVSTLAKLGVDTAGEGAEEVLSGLLGTVGQKLTYADDKELGELFSKEDALDSFIGGAILGNISGTGKAIKDTASGRDYASGMTNNEKAVVDKLYKDAVAEKQADGTKLSQKEKAKIYDATLNNLEKGYIDIGTIESVLGEKASELAKTDRLSESYNEKTRRSQAFEADLMQYDAKQREVVKKAAESGILNNTNRTHEFVDMIAKISADKGVSFDFLNNQKLKETGFALDGKTVNGFLKNGNVSINIDSKKALNSVVGHEITHVLEGTELYGVLQEAVKSYATTKGEYDAKLKAITELYKGVKDANAEAELTADLIGDYLFTDSEFINKLSAEHRNVFQMIYDEIKYLCKVATSGSKEARELEKAKRLFEKAYRETANKKENTIKYSLYLSDADIPDYLKAGSRRNKNRQKRYEEGQQVVISTEAEFDSFVAEAIVGESDKIVAYGKVDDVLADMVKNKSGSRIDISDAYLELLSNDIWHAYREHSTAKEPGDMNMSIADLQYALKNVNRADVVNANKYNDGSQRVTLAIPTNDGMMMLVELVSKSAGSLRLKTGWKVTNDKFVEKYKSSMPSAGNQGSTNTARDNTASTNSIPQIGENATSSFKINEITDEGLTMTYVRVPNQNTQKYGSTYGQNIEPAGEYMSMDTMQGKHKINGYEYGTIQFKKPLVLEHVNTGDTGWKKTVSDMYNGLTGKKLSKALIKDGYDAIVTYDEYGYSEIVNLNGTKLNDKPRVKNSLSDDAKVIAPVGNYNVYGNDVALESVAAEDIGPLPEEVAPVQQPASTLEDIGPVREDVDYTPDRPDYPEKPIETVEDRNDAKLQNYKIELQNLEAFREAAHQSFNKQIAELQAKYDGKKNKTTQVANELLQSIERQKRLRDNTDAAYEKRISDLKNRIDKMSTKEFKTAEQRRVKQEGYREMMSELMGDTSTWKDKKLGISYKVNTLRRNLRDIVRNEDGSRDIERADAIYDALQGTYNRNEANLNREANAIKDKFRKLKITPAEDKYIQMLGEFRDNPKTTISEDKIKEFYEANKDKIDTEKVDKIIKDARSLYDGLFQRVNAVLREQGMKEIEYQKGYFPHFNEEVQPWWAKALNWKVKNNEIPTDLAGLTEMFNPDRSWQSFNKHRTSDKTSYSFSKGLDMYVNGALDWIYHIPDIQKRRAFENEIRYRHSEQGVKDKIEALKNNEEYDADEFQEQVDLIYGEAKNPLNNFVSTFRSQTNTLTSKKHTMDRGMEENTNREVYSFMTNISNRATANMVAGSISSALTNFIPITQSWGEVSPKSSLRAMGDTIRSTFQDDGTIDKSDFLTNRLRKNENLNKTNWDKVSDKIGFLMEVIDSFTSQTVWRSKYLENIDSGMSENESIRNADQFAENVMAGRSRGNNPTIFDAKNPIAKIFTAFQLEVANQYGYMLKDMPQDVGSKSKANLIKGYATMFFGAYAYNALYSSLTGRDAAFDPVGIIEELLRDIGWIGDDEEEPTDIVMDLAENILDEVPFVGGLMGGGRIPISSALPYDGNFMDLLEGTTKLWTERDLSQLTEWLNPVYYLAFPMAGGQIRKMNQGLAMFDDDLPIAGSYTDSGNLRFPVEDTFGSRVKASLFGQYASKNARDYFDNDRAPLKEKQIQEYIDLDLPIRDYWEYRENMPDGTLDEKFDYIAGLPVSVEQKNIMINNIVDREEPVDMSNYDDFENYEEFNWYVKNTEKYNFLQDNGISYSEYKKNEDTKKLYDDAYRWAKDDPERSSFLSETYGISAVDYKSLDEDSQEAYTWAYKNPERRTVSEAVTEDVVQYRKWTSELNGIHADKDAKGNSVNGSAKKKKVAYINNLKLDYGQKIILFRTIYKDDDTYNSDIVEYLNGRKDLSYNEMVTILVELGFSVMPDGTVKW